MQTTRTDLKAQNFALRRWVDLGIRYQRKGELTGAMRAFEEAAYVAPEMARLWLVLAALARDACDIERAHRYLDGAIDAGAPDTVQLRRAFLLPPLMSSTAEIERTRCNLARALTTLDSAPLPHVHAPLSDLPWLHVPLAYHGQNDRDLNALVGRVLRRACPSLSHRAGHVDCPRLPGAKLRVGFVSSNLRDHAIGRLNAGLIAGLDRDRFEPIVFFVDGIRDDFAQRIADSAAEAVVVPRDLDAARQAISQRTLDVLYFTDVGSDPISYFLAFARLARVQCATWGHPVTTGLETIDYFISSKDLEPFNAQGHYTEELVQLRGLTFDCPRPERVDSPLSRAAIGLPGEAHLYLCPQPLSKFHPHFDQVLADILERDPSGVLGLLEPAHAEWAELIRERLRARGADVDAQLRFIPRRGRREFLALLASADVVLDAYPFGGGHSSLEALACGVPVVTRPGAFMRGRITHSFYRAMGWTELCAANARAYAETAVRLATDVDYRANCAVEITARSGVLFGAKTAVTEHERFFERVTTSVS